MTWIDIAWPMMGATSLTLALIHLLVWSRQWRDPAQLMLSLAAASVAVAAIFELLMMRAQATGQYAELLRWGHVPVALLIIALVGFVRLRFRAGRPWLGLAVCALRLAALAANFLTGVNLNFATITTLEQVGTWGAGTISLPIGSVNPWMVLAQLSNLLLVVFLLDAIVTVRRRGDALEGSRALWLCGSMALFVLLAGSWSALVVVQGIRGPLTINIAFLAVIVAMSREVGGDVLRAADLSRRLLASESMLRVTEQRLQRAAQAAGIGLWSWDIERQDLWLTDTGNVLLGLAPTDRTGRGALLAQVHPDDRQAILDAGNEAIQQTGEYACEYRLPQAEGGMRWISAKGRVEYDASGAPRLIRGVVLDITERRQAEERFRLVIDGAPNAMLMVDGDGRITLANARAEQMFGSARAELLGQDIEALVPMLVRGGRQRGNGGQDAVPGSRAGIEVRKMYARRTDGNEVPVEISLTPLPTADKSFLLASLTDISQRQRLEQEAALQRDELAHLSRVTLLGQLSGSLAHELNQPLTAVLSNAQAALRFLDRDPPDLGEVRDSLVHIVENDKRASEVIRRLRAMLRKEQVNYQQLDINQVVTEVLQLINSDVLNRNVAITLDLGADLPAISGDRVQLQQVLLNLVINACDAMADVDAGRVLAVRTRAMPGPAVEVLISDLGRGVPADELERIFMPFVSSKAEGIGLGLAICRTIIEAHRGTLWATNNAVRGATLHFELPALMGPAEPPGRPP